jgi:hypothetical protein
MAFFRRKREMTEKAISTKRKKPSKPELVIPAPVNWHVLIKRNTQYQSLEQAELQQELDDENDEKKYNKPPPVIFDSPFRLFSREGGFMRKDRKGLVLYSLHEIHSALFYPNYNPDVIQAKVNETRKDNDGVGTTETNDGFGDYNLDNDDTYNINDNDNDDDTGTSSNHTKLWGRTGGRVIDRQINQVVDGKIIQSNKVFPYNEKKMKEIQSAGVRVIETTYRHLNPQVQIFFHFMTIELGYIPLQAQIAVGSIDIGECTFLEHIWIHPGRGELVVLENKYTSRDFYIAYNGYMKHPYQKQRNSLQNQAHLQLGIGCWLAEQTFMFKIHKAFVVRMYFNETRPVLEPLQSWVMEHIKEAIDKIRLYVRKQREIQLGLIVSSVAPLAHGFAHCAVDTTANTSKKQKIQKL